ncbi:hypothetical protein NESM_000281900 [Novymonas esmeraldas]|uniref:Uncharacterized protein n=1 Tax=Novymonas esmeraldas TaxID=1808958 RepID=A0AAW0F6A1_9TRYP
MSNRTSGECVEHLHATPPGLRGRVLPSVLSLSTDMEQACGVTAGSEDVSALLATDHAHGLSDTTGNEDSDLRSTYTGSCERTDEPRWRTERPRRQRASLGSDVRRREEEEEDADAVDAAAAHPVSSTSVASSYFSSHVAALDGARARPTEPRPAEHRYDTAAVPQSRGEASVVASRLLDGSGGGSGGMPLPSVQPATRQMRVRVGSASAPRALSSADREDPYHFLRMPSAGTVYASSHGGSDGDSVNGGAGAPAGALASQPDIYLWYSATPTLSSAPTSARQGREGPAAPRVSVASSGERVVRQVALEYGEWLSPPSPSPDTTQEALGRGTTETHLHPAPAPASCPAAAAVALERADCGVVQTSAEGDAAAWPSVARRVEALERAAASAMGGAFSEATPPLAPAMRAATAHKPSTVAPSLVDTGEAATVIIGRRPPPEAPAPGASTAVPGVGAESPPAPPPPLPPLRTRAPPIRRSVAPPPFAPQSPRAVAAADSSDSVLQMRPALLAGALAASGTAAVRMTSTRPADAVATASANWRSAEATTPPASTQAASRRVRSPSPAASAASTVTPLLLPPLAAAAPFPPSSTEEPRRHTRAADVSCAAPRHGMKPAAPSEAPALASTAAATVSGSGRVRHAEGAGHPQEVNSSVRGPAPSASVTLPRGHGGGGDDIPAAAAGGAAADSAGSAEPPAPKEEEEERVPGVCSSDGGPADAAVVGKPVLSIAVALTSSQEQPSHGVDAATAAAVGPSETESAGTRASRSPSGRHRRVGFKQDMEVVLPDSKSLRAPAAAWLEFRNPTMREQGREMMPSTEEVYSHLTNRSNAVCALVVVDEDAVRKPCLVVSGLSVRVYEEDKAVALANKRMSHGVMRALRTSGGASGRLMHRTSYYDDDDDDDSCDSVGVPGRTSATASLSSRATSLSLSVSRSGLPPDMKSFVLLPDKKDRRSKSGDADSSGYRAGEFDRYLHRFDVDETLSRRAGHKECRAVSLELLMLAWATGHNTCLLLGNGSGRGTQSLEVVIEAVESAMDLLRDRLRDPASRVELHICMGDVADDDEGNGGVRVNDLLASSSDSEEEEEEDDDDDSDDGERNRRRRRRRVSAVSAAYDSGAVRQPVQLARSPLFGPFARGLRSVKVDDAITDRGAIGRALTRGYLHFNMSTHSSRNNSMSNLSTHCNAAPRTAHTSFATLRLKTICRGVDMRSARLSARETEVYGGKARGHERHSRSVEYDADVLVSSLQLVFFGTEYMVLDSLVQRSPIYRMVAREREEGFIHAHAPRQPPRADFQSTNWASAVDFLESLLYDALGGRTRTLTCLCLSEYDLRATLWLRTVCRARRITNATPNCGNVRNYLVYLLEQYDNLSAQQRRRKQDERRAGHTPVARLAVSPSIERGRFSRTTAGKELGQWSVYCVKKMIDDLDEFLASPTGTTPSIERLEIANEVIAVAPPEALSRLPLARLPATFFSRNRRGS